MMLNTVALMTAPRNGTAPEDQPKLTTTQSLAVLDTVSTMTDTASPSAPPEAMVSPQGRQCNLVF